MAILARASCTLSTVRDVASTTRYYKLQSSTASKPAKPTTNPPGGWTTTEPSYTEGSTNSLYFTDLTVFTDGDFAYSDVSLSSSYEAAKQAYNKAVIALDASTPIATKTYSGLIGSANDAANASFYFAKIHPTSYAVQWKVQLRISVTAPEAYSQSVDIQLGGYGSSFSSYDSYTVRNSLLGICYINLYRATQAGISTNKKGHALGVGLRSSTNPTTASAARTIKVELLSTENCTVDMLDTAVKYAALDGTGSTNYSGLTEVYVAPAGQNATNNTNTHYTVFSGAVKAGSFGVKRYTLLMKDTDTTWVSFVNQANSIATTKTVSTQGHILGKVIYSYGGTEYASGVNTSTVYDVYSVDLRYSTNCGTTLTVYRPVYLVGTIGSDGLFYLDQSQWWTQTIPTTEDGKTYIYIGEAYSSYQIYLATDNLAYQYYQGEFMTLEQIETAKAQTAANNAMTAANGKNKVFHQATAPATSAGLTAGDIWFDTSNDYKMSRWTGSAWTEEQFGESAIADASIGNAKIKDASIEHAKIKSLDMGKATVGKLKAEFIDVDNLTALSANIGGFEIKRLERIVSPTYITDSLGVWTYDPYTCMYAIEDSGEWFLCSMPVSGLSDPANFVLEISYSIIPFNTGSVTVFGISGSMRTQIGTVTLDNTPPYYLDSVYTKRYIRIIEASVSAYESVEIRVATDGEYTPESTIHLMGIEGILISIYSQNDSGSVLSRNTTGLSTRENLNLPGARFGTDGISHISVDGTYIAIYDGGIDIGYPITDEDGAAYIEKTGGLAAKTSKGETGGLMGKDPAYPLVSWDGSAHLADVTATNVQANGNVEATNLLKHHGGFTVPQIQKGTTALVTAPASGYIDIPVTFNKEFAGNPTILCGLQGNAANGKYGYLSCSPVRSTISTTGVTLRVYNADSSAHNTYVSWAAIY